MTTAFYRSGWRLYLTRMGVTEHTPSFATAQESANQWQVEAQNIRTAKKPRDAPFRFMTEELGHKEELKQLIKLRQRHQKSRETVRKFLLSRNYSESYYRYYYGGQIFSAEVEQKLVIAEAEHNEREAAEDTIRVMLRSGPIMNKPMLALFKASLGR